MTCKYVKITLSEKANQYIKKYIKYGFELDQQVRKTIDLSKGVVFTYLPDRTKDDDVYSFKWGGVAHRDESINCISYFIYSYLSNNDGSICLMVDALSEPDESFPNKVKNNIVCLNNQVYFYISSEALELYKVKDVIIEAEQPNYFLSILSTPTNGVSGLISKGLLMSEQISDLVISVEYIIIGAYDGEGYLVWEAL